MRTVEVTDELQAYLDGLVPKRDQVLARMEEEAHRENIPIVDPHEGMLLYLLVKIAGAKRVLELGTATGYSGIWLLRGTDGGSLTTFEVDHKRAERARANFSDAGLGKQALVLEQDAVAGLEKVDQRFDACFIDLLNGFPSEDVTRRALELCLQRLEGGALLMADNALRQGEVARPKNQQARNVAHYNELVAKHPRLESVVIPIRDGLSVARVRD
ncbi:MAG: O-methyltransferase [Chloroflexi bacterium]|nr:MAG: O-methyltransferase [Chloroflexota bacterium]TMF76043.1 MAG: O-methyltransferase [Chloroflexota bacterium]TMF92114.1 MAG: O-methyltransferase [Chloroflexota bacterium]TMG46155.1 MAG: O-methyltransferase [Chloroflexota bacterium]